MKCPKCNGATHVVDRRGQRRRRECNQCGYRFSTMEILAEEVKKLDKPVQKEAKPEPKPMTKPKPKQKFSVQKAASARRKIEDLKDLALLEDDYDYDYIPEKW